MSVQHAQQADTGAPAVVVVSDGKPGHLNQSLGLAEALQRRCAGLVVRSVPALSRAAALRVLLTGNHEPGAASLLIGAGHGTHLTLLALRRALRCPAIVLMRPSLPGILFDLRIEPRHDGGSETERCWLSDGPVNRLRPGAGPRTQGLILIGGPSPHFAWDEPSLLDQLAAICDGSGHWQLSTSRRTPASFVASLRERDLPGLDVHDAADLPPGWLTRQLPAARCCWVSPDSASMVYEALTAGCAVGTLDLAPRAGSRVAGAVADLAARGLITRFADRRAGEALPLPRHALAEADRLAARIEERGWLS
ncbi:MAG: ELM1/GtrOC1 family putative glycosyltransferase [Halieaceae bacterium]|jgi:mitochondrial fission protein ELM1|nr:ELM1/GtrOC1 family putative glycosyltransferase [Halieaceae bacterium]